MAIAKVGIIYGFVGKKNDDEEDLDFEFWIDHLIVKKKEAWGWIRNVNKITGEKSEWSPWVYIYTAEPGSKINFTSIKQEITADGEIL